MKNKKGQGLSMNVIVGIIILLLVLLVVILIFGEQFGFAFKGFGDTFRHVFTLSNETSLTLK